MPNNLIAPSFILLLLFICPTTFAQKIKVSFTNNSSTEVFSGKVFLYFSKDIKNPKDVNFGSGPFCCFSKEVKNIKPDQEIYFDDNVKCYPMPISDIERGDYYVQAVWDKNLGGRSINNSTGNMFSLPVKLRFTKKGKKFLQ